MNSENKPKRSYHFQVCEVENNKVKDDFCFNFGGHHDLAHLVEKAVAVGNITEKHAKQLVCGVRLLHHAMKKYPENEAIKAFAPKFKEFKDALKAQANANEK
ncbi:MAG: DUF3861 family protein [Muribaculaceae bacterium]|nr:DUF3861 family protein [Muribaculaceae bacterium]